MRVNDVVKRILALGLGTLLAKIDVESTFRNIPVHPHGCHLLHGYAVGGLSVRRYDPTLWPPFSP